MEQQNEASKQPPEKARASYLVYDINQRGDLPRLHDVITRMYPDGQEPDVLTYKLYADSSKGCAMPQEHAYKFLCDPAFKVIAPNGNRIMPISKFDPSKPLTALADDEVVAKYTELSRENLFRRVKLLPGSEDVRPNATIEECAAFLITWRKSLSGMTEGDRALAEKMAAAGVDGLGEEAMDGMFGARERKVA